MTENVITEQLTEKGRKIEHDSFTIVDAEAGEYDYSEDQWQVVRRMIHASADFEFNGLAQFSKDGVQAGIKAVLSGAPVVVDVEMITAGLSKIRLAHFGIQTYHFISDEDVITQAKLNQTTRAVMAMRKAHQLGHLDGAIVGVGNAPTALLEVLRLIKEEGAKPALIIGMPVGFVSAEESKAVVAEQQEIPFIVIEGRKGGSTLVVSALHALMALAEKQQNA